MDTEAIATELLDALDQTKLVKRITARDSGFGVDAAYDVSVEILRRRQARGERPVGRKIGFTNRTIWEEYGVYHPIWAPVYDSTVRYLDGTSGSMGIGRLAQPLIEAEIVLHFQRAPAGARDEFELLSCIDWIAHGCEIVQCHFPGWKLQAGDSIADFGLHGALLVGPKRAVADNHALVAQLRSFTIALAKGGAVQNVGRGAYVLDSPLLAMMHLLSLLKDQPQFDPVQPGEVVTTGTVTTPMAIHAGETWSTALSGIDLDGLSLRFL